VRVTKRATSRNKRRIPKIADLMELPVAKRALLLEVEVIAVVLYTGPMVPYPRPPPHLPTHPLPMRALRSALCRECECVI
jgi:hypothetical protein